MTWLCFKETFLGSLYDRNKYKRAVLTTVFKNISLVWKGTKKKATSILQYAHFNVFYTVLMNLSPPPENASWNITNTSHLECLLIILSMCGKIPEKMFLLSQNVELEVQETDVQKFTSCTWLFCHSWWAWICIMLDNMNSPKLL